MRDAAIWLGQPKFELDGDGVMVEAPSGKALLYFRMSRATARAGAQRLLNMLDAQDMRERGIGVIELRRTG